jgi:hypothetical protein
MISRNLNNWVKGDANREAVRRTIDDLSTQISSLQKELATVKSGSSNGSGLSPIQLQQVAGLIAGRSQAVIGQDVQDPQLPGQIGGGTVTNLAAGAGISLTPSPIVGSGSIAVTTPVPAGAWTAWTPTLTNVTLGAGGSAAGTYFQAGKYVTGRLLIVLGTAGALTGYAQFSLPVASVNHPGSANDIWLGGAVLLDSGVMGYSGMVTWVSTTTAGLLAFDSSATYLTLAATGAAVPFTWGVGDQIDCRFFYEAA